MALDYQFDVTATGRTIKILHVVDEHTWESLSDLVAYSIDADATVGVLDKIVGQRGAHPRFIRCDNGPELTAERPARLVPVHRRRHLLHRPWFPMAEPMGRVLRVPDARRAAVHRSLRHPEAQVLVADWREDYNDYRPHSALEMLTPTEYARQWRTHHPVELS